MVKSYNVLMVVATDLPEGGGDTNRIKTLAKAMHGAGHRVQLLAENSSGNVDVAYLQQEGVIYNEIPFRYLVDISMQRAGGLGFLASKYESLKRLLSEIRQMDRERHIDIIWMQNLAFHDIYMVTRLARRLGIKTILSYDDERMEGSGLMRKLIYLNQVAADKYLSKNADAIVGISNYLKKKYDALVQHKVTTEIIPTTIDMAQWAFRPEIKKDVPVLLYYGAFYGFDELEKIIDAVKLLKEKGKRIRFYLLGWNRKKPDYMKEIQDKINTLGLSDDVIMPGFIKHDQLKQYIDESNILIGLRGDSEWSHTGFSTKLSEYLATGRMVICSAVGDNTYYLEDRKSALIMPLDCTVHNIADALELAISDDDLRHRIGTEGRKVALENFDTAVVEQKMNRLFDSLFE